MGGEVADLFLGELRSLSDVGHGKVGERSVGIAVRRMDQELGDVEAGHRAEVDAGLVALAAFFRGYEDDAVC